MITCETTYTEDGTMYLEFYSDTGKFGTEELLDEYILSPEQLLDILQEWEFCEWRDNNAN
tara:strand:+ start:357 stop:536 length:180 start_codon:yes stop_codon:yes gene_type:complete